MCHLGQGEARRGSGKEKCLLSEGTSVKNDLKEQKFLGRFLPQPSGLAVRPHGSGRPRAQRGACAPSLRGVFATNPSGSCFQSFQFSDVGNPDDVKSGF